MSKSSRWADSLLGTVITMLIWAIICGLVSIIWYEPVRLFLESPIATYFRQIISSDTAYQMQNRFMIGGLFGLVIGFLAALKAGLSMRKRK